MSVASQRLIVPISAADKRRVEAKAKAVGHISTAEYVRRAALNYEPEEAAAEAELRALLPVLDRLHTATVDQLDRTDRALDRALAHFANLSSSAQS